MYLVLDWLEAFSISRQDSSMAFVFFCHKIISISQELCWLIKICTLRLQSWVPYIYSAMLNRTYARASLWWSSIAAFSVAELFCVDLMELFTSIIVIFPCLSGLFRAPSYHKELIPGNGNIHSLKIYEKIVASVYNCYIYLCYWFCELMWSRPSFIIW